MMYTKITEETLDKIDALDDAHVSYVPEKNVRGGEIKPYKPVVNIWGRDQQGTIGDWLYRDRRGLLNIHKSRSTRLTTD